MKIYKLSHFLKKKKIASVASKIYYEIFGAKIMNFDAKINNIFGAKIQLLKKLKMIFWKEIWDFLDFSAKINPRILVIFGAKVQICQKIMNVKHLSLCAKIQMYKEIRDNGIFEFKSTSFWRENSKMWKIRWKIILT